MSWNENPENPPEQQPMQEDPEESELHGPSDGLEIGEQTTPANPFQRFLSLFWKSSS